MTAASLLAKVAGMKVLVLEKHSERGGLTHTFRRDGASWDVGVHYVGDVQPGSPIRGFLDFMSGKALDWNPMPHNFERFVYPGIDFTVPADKKEYIEKLIALFPDEKAAIRRYFVDIVEAANYHRAGIAQFMMPWPVSSLIGQYRRWTEAKCNQTTQEYLDKSFKSEKLKALLATQWGDFGIIPSDSAFNQHAIVVESYFGGAFFPDGGSSRIARTFEIGVEEKGGCVKVCQDVKAILTQGPRVIGVKALDGRGATPKDVVYLAPIVISNAGAEVTYKQLLPTQGPIGQLTAPIRDFIKPLENGLAGVALYIRFKGPVSSLGIKGENHWINSTFDHNNIDEQTEACLAGRAQHAYLSFPSAKSGDDRWHTAEILAFIKGDAFYSWKGTTRGARGKEYMELKNRIADGLLNLAESANPGFKDLVQYAELSTPLSVEDFTSHPGGVIYGLKGNPYRFGSSVLAKPSPIAGLHLTGQDAASLGVVGAMCGGMFAAGQVMGGLGTMRMMISKHKGKTATEIPLSAAVRSPDKKRAVLVSRQALTPSIWKLEFKTDEPISAGPGQYAQLRVAPFEWRYYSIAKTEKKHFTLVVSTATGGDGSIFANTAELGTETEVELPFGAYQLQRNSNRKVFIATGTGLAPFLPMFDTLALNGELKTAELLFGCKYTRDDITQYFSFLPKKTICATGEPAAEGIYHGRVTKALGEIEFEAATTDFYLCGSPAMVADCQTILTLAGATNIYTEPY
jgi:all-trans-retinol 13,14-reductase